MKSMVKEEKNERKVESLWHGGGHELKEFALNTYKGGTLIEAWPEHIPHSTVSFYAYRCRRSKLL